MSYTMLMPLLNTEENYAAGFEAGMLWQIMEAGRPIKNYLVRTSNLEQIKLMAKRFHYDLKVNITEGYWSSITAVINQSSAN